MKSPTFKYYLEMNLWYKFDIMSVLLPGKFHGWRSQVGYSPWGREELDMTEQLHFRFSLSCIGEGNGNPLQCSCLENPRDWGAWWAAVYGVAQSRTRLKRLSSSSSSSPVWDWHVHTTILKIDNRKGPTVYQRELCSIFCNILCGKIIWKRVGENKMKKFQLL